MEDLVLGSVRSGGRIDDLERDTLNRVGGAGQGESIFQTVEGLRKGDSGVLKELYGMEGEGGKSVFAKGELEKIKNLPTAEEQGEAIAKALKKANLTDVFAFGEQGGSGKSVRGVQTQYVEANERFVQSVHAFAAALRGVGIKVPGPTSRDLQDAAESLTSGGNPGEV